MASSASGGLLETNAALMLIELARYPEAEFLLEQNVKHVLPGVSTIHLYSTYAHLLLRTGDLATASRHLELARDEASNIQDAQFAIELHMVGTEIALWSGDAAAAFEIAREGLDRLLEMDDAILLGQLAMPAMHAAADIAVRARTARDPAAAEAAVDERARWSTAIEPPTERLPERDALAVRELGWRMAHLHGRARPSRRRGRSGDLGRRSVPRWRRDLRPSSRRTSHGERPRHGPGGAT